ncbi:MULTISPECIES: OmpA family protein [unclassified Thioalkalivibrio]|uniref:OmpA family protein n=1 Tax=unclassified Thioalkalivibrio TaxID=2621013 RepID=UPI000370188C|nr:MULTISPECIES: OmpA family protein [unclassified Thioalkalivibrio]
MNAIIRHNMLAAIIATLLLTGCNIMPTQGERAPDEAANANGEPARDARDTAHRDDSHAAPRNAVYLARDDDAVSARRQHLLDEGHESVALDRVGFYMDVLTARLRQELAGHDVEMEREGRIITLIFPGAKAFETNSAEIHPDMVATLDALGQVLEEYDASLVTIAGHTDSAGARGYNQHLSEQRALSVGRHLHDNGVGEARIIAIGYGPDRPIADNDTSHGRALNRRVELRVEPLTAT